MASVFRFAASSTASRFSSLVALSMMAATAAVAPAAAREIEGLPPQCAKAGDELAKLKCGRAVFQKRTVDAEARSADAKARGAAADSKIKAADEKIAEAKKSDDEVARAEKCFAFIKEGIGNNKFKREAVLESAGGKVTIENACPVAARYGYDRRASAATPAVR